MKYRSFTIEIKKDSHCALIYKDSNLVKCIAGNIFADGTNDAIAKAKKYIDLVSSPDQFASTFYSVSVERIKEQYAINAEGLERMYVKSIKTGKKIGGYTSEELRLKAIQYRNLAK